MTAEEIEEGAATLYARLYTLFSRTRNHEPHIPNFNQISEYAQQEFRDAYKAVVYPLLERLDKLEMWMENQEGIIQAQIKQQQAALKLLERTLHPAEKEVKDVGN